MHQYGIIIEIAEQLRQTLARAEQNPLILHGQTGVLIQVQGAPQHRHPLPVPVRPQIVLGIIDHPHAAAAVLTMPGQQRLDDLLLQLFPARRGAGGRLHRDAAQTLKQQHVRPGMLFMRHHAIDHRHAHRTAARQSGDLPGQLPRHAGGGETSRQERHRISLRVIQGPQRRSAFFTDTLHPAQLFAKQVTQFGSQLFHCRLPL